MNRRLLCTHTLASRRRPRPLARVQALQLRVADDPVALRAWEVRLRADNPVVSFHDHKSAYRGRNILALCNWNVKRSSGFNCMLWMGKTLQIIALFQRKALNIRGIISRSPSLLLLNASDLTPCEYRGIILKKRILLALHWSDVSGLTEKCWVGGFLFLIATPIGSATGGVNWLLEQFAVPCPPRKSWYDVICLFEDRNTFNIDAISKVLTNGKQKHTGGSLPQPGRCFAFTLSKTWLTHFKSALDMLRNELKVSKNGIQTNCDIA